MFRQPIYQFLIRYIDIWNAQNTESSRIEYLEEYRIEQGRKDKRTKEGN